MKQTTNYSLNKIELADSPPDITVLNPNFDKIDTEMKRLTDKDTSVDATIEQIKKDYLPKTGGDITNNLTVKSKYVARSVNGEVADANGNIVIDVKGDVRSVNGIRPDEAGNVTIKAGVVSVNEVKPDPDTGNIDLGERIKDASSRTDILEAVAQAGFNGKALQADVEVIKNSYVRSVNSTSPDTNGNVSIDLSGYAMKTDLSGYATKTELSGYATKTELTNGLAGKSDSGHTHNYVSKSGDTVSGNLTVTGTLKGATIQATSDIRKKSDLKKIDSCLTKLDVLTAYTYNLKDDSGRRAGLIAQEVEQVLPEAVREDEDGFKSLDYNGVIALLLGAVKELREEVEGLKNGK